MVVYFLKKKKEGKRIDKHWHRYFVIATVTGKDNARRIPSISEDIQNLLYILILGPSNKDFGLCSNFACIIQLIC